MRTVSIVAEDELHERLNDTESLLRTSLSIAFGLIDTCKIVSLASRHHHLDEQLASIPALANNAA